MKNKQQDQMVFNGHSSKAINTPVMKTLILITTFIILIGMNVVKADSRTVFSPASVQNNDSTGNGTCEVSFTYTDSGAYTYKFTNTSYSHGNIIRYLWNFGDGDTSNLQNPTHTYSTSSYYTVCLSIWTDSSCYAQSCVTIGVGPKTGCSAYFTTTIISGDSVQFNNYSTTQDSLALSLWIFGDGDSSTSTDPIHVYQSSGTYNVCLYITSKGGCTASMCRDTGVTVGECSAVFSYNYDTHSTVNFSGTAQTSFTLSSYNWSFGDGDNNTTSLTPSHSYAANGTYMVIFTMYANNGCSAADTQYVRVPQPVCNASFTYSTDGDTIHFTNTSTSNGSLSYEWNFGSNVDTSSSENPIYISSGDTFACLTIISDSGCTANYCSTIIFGGDSVWPGDANDDLYVNNADLIPIGLYYGDTGPARATTTNAWAPQFAVNWDSSQTDSRNRKFVDCNGDGTINSDDTMAIYLNYGNYHPHYGPRTASRSTEGTIELSIVTDSTSYHAGSVVHASVMLGSSAAPVSDMYGLAYTITVDNSIIQPGTMSFQYNSSSFLGVKNSNVLVMTNINNGIVGTAVTGIDHVNRTGYGKVGDLYFTLADNNPNAQQSIAISSNLAVDAGGNEKSVQAINDTVNVTAGIQQVVVSKENISIYPNPSSGMVTISSGKSIDEIKVSNVLGQLIYDWQPKQSYLNFEITDDGVYFITVTSNSETTTQKLIITR